MKVLLLEDDLTLGGTLKMALEIEGFEIIWAKTIDLARQHLAVHTFDVHLLDWNLPDGKGIDLLPEILEMGAAPKVLFLTAQTDETSAIEALSRGALDYIRKPFSVKELVVRLKRAGDRFVEKENSLNFEGLSLNLDTRELKYRKELVALAPKESLVLEQFLRAPGEQIAREILLQRAGFDEDTSDRAIDSHLSHLRAKIKKLGALSIEIKSNYGNGYVLRKKKSA